MAKERSRAKKTNALREIEAAGLPCEYISFECPEALSGIDVATLLDQDPSRVFKTLVTQAKSGQHYVFMVPVAQELDLKRAAATVNEKAIAMIPAKELLPLTGYIHGGCSPVGMRTPFPTVIDETAELYDTVMFSGGRRGLQVEMAPEDLAKLIDLRFADITA